MIKRREFLQALVTLGGVAALGGFESVEAAERVHENYFVLMDVDGKAYRGAFNDGTDYMVLRAEDGDVLRCVELTVEPVAVEIRGGRNGEVRALVVKRIDVRMKTADGVPHAVSNIKLEAVQA